MKFKLDANFYLRYDQDFYRDVTFSSKTPLPLMISPCCRRLLSSDRNRMGGNQKSSLEGWLPVDNESMFAYAVLWWNGSRWCHWTSETTIDTSCNLQFNASL